VNLWWACGLTVLTETVFLWLCGYRDRLSVLLAICVNAATNLSLNLGLAALRRLADPAVLIYALEAAVVAAEYGVYALAFGPSRRLFGLTLAANALSYGLGVLIFGHV
jgi:hypothetical protein